MKRTYRYVEASGFVAVSADDGSMVEIPVFGGILKHPDVAQLRQLLLAPSVARKYAHEALRKAPWRALELFPREWLVARLREANLPDGRRRALEFMLDDEAASDRERRDRG
jgi:hypothetical protein